MVFQDNVRDAMLSPAAPTPSDEDQDQDATFLDMFAAALSDSSYFPGCKCVHDTLGEEIQVDSRGEVGVNMRRGFETDVVGLRHTLSDLTLEYNWDEVCVATDNFAGRNCIGSGRFSTVFRGYAAEGISVAVKVFLEVWEGGVEAGDCFEEEVSYLSRCRHPNVVRLLGFAVCAHPSRKALVYELLPGGSAHARLHSVERDPWPWKERLRTMLEVSRGLAHLHRYRPEVFHRDIKSASVLFSDKGVAKIADFGLACGSRHRDERCCRVAVNRGTPGYAAPEYTETSIATEASEVYSAGMVLLEFLTGRLPAKPSEIDRDQWDFLLAELRPDLEGVSDRILAMLDATGGWPLPVAASVTRLVLACIHDDAERRPCFLEMVGILHALAPMQPSAQEPQPRKPSKTLSDPGGGPKEKGSKGKKKKKRKEGKGEAPAQAAGEAGAPPAAGAAEEPQRLAAAAGLSPVSSEATFVPCVVAMAVPPPAVEPPGCRPDAAPAAAEESPRSCVASEWALFEGGGGATGSTAPAPGGGGGGEAPSTSPPESPRNGVPEGPGRPGMGPVPSGASGGAGPAWLRNLRSALGRARGAEGIDEAALVQDAIALQASAALGASSGARRGAEEFIDPGELGDTDENGEPRPANWLAGGLQVLRRNVAGLSGRSQASPGGSTLASPGPGTGPEDNPTGEGRAWLQPIRGLLANARREQRDANPSPTDEEQEAWRGSQTNPAQFSKQISLRAPLSTASCPGSSCTYLSRKASSQQPSVSVRGATPRPLAEPFTDEELAAAILEVAAATDQAPSAAPAPCPSPRHEAAAPNLEAMGRLFHISELDLDD